VIFGGPSPEHDVSVLTGLQAAHALRATDDNVHALYWTKTADWFEVDPDLEATAFVNGVPTGATALRLVTGTDGGFVVEGGRLGRTRKVQVDVAVVCCHGGPGEDGTLQAALDLARVPYTGPTVSGAALGMDKLAFGGVISAAGLPTLPRLALTADSSPPAFSGPYIVKPRFGGSSIGIDVVADFETALARLKVNRHLIRGAVLEPYRSDLFDLQVAIRSWPVTELSMLERPLRSDRGSGSAEILGYADKYVGGEGMASAPREVPAKVPADLETRIRSISTAAAQLAGVRGVARIDFLSDGESEVFVNEINTIPGSLARYLFDPPTGFSPLLADMIDEGRNSVTRSYDAAGADGTVLRGAASIAAKLA
jgi:D-alanine-D-alanine ligase